MAHNFSHPIRLEITKPCIRVDGFHPAQILSPPPQICNATPLKKKERERDDVKNTLLACALRQKMSPPPPISHMLMLRSDVRSHSIPLKGSLSLPRQSGRVDIRASERTTGRRRISAPPSPVRSNYSQLTVPGWCISYGCPVQIWNENISRTNNRQIKKGRAKKQEEYLYVYLPAGVKS